MSVYVLSDDSDHSNHEDIDFMKKFEDDAKEDCVDLTQEDLEPDNEPYRSPTISDPYEDLPPVQLTGPVATLTSNSSTNSGTTRSGSDGTTSSSGVATLSSGSNSYGSLGSGSYGMTSGTNSSSCYGGSECSSGSKKELCTILDLILLSSSPLNHHHHQFNCLETKDAKSKKKADAQAKKQKLAQERAAKAAAAEANKVYKPGECMKYMHIEMHPSLLEQWYCADVPREAGAAGAKIETVKDLCDPALVMWSRRVPRALTASNGQVELSAARQRCPRALYTSTISEISHFVRNRSLSAHIQQAAALADCELTLVVLGVKDYFKAANRRQNGVLITEIELEMALTDLLVSARCDSALVDTPNELALLIVQFTKAIAEEPHKKIKRSFDEQAEFYMRGDNKKCVPVDKDGNGASRLWQQMIAVLPGSSLETSRSVCAQYKSPLALYQALQLPNGVNELADIGVSRTGVPGSKSRRLGPEFARKLRILFTAEDGDVLID
ncbi:crossover junction endonuclease EME1 [Leguminivora glycinivorella]|uniref:crossover junction endonuclease EME1 n=1 Tax=Leguminivora glycinivorella TaxID=1035111 RepID=UPI00201009DC|nr:crossover junction endonuclease EME1 [Leguminivora glycinivorella]